MRIELNTWAELSRIERRALLQVSPAEACVRQASRPSLHSIVLILSQESTNSPFEV